MPLFVFFNNAKNYELQNIFYCLLFYIIQIQFMITKWEKRQRLINRIILTDLMIFAKIFMFRQSDQLEYALFHLKNF